MPADTWPIRNQINPGILILGNYFFSWLFVRHFQDPINRSSIHRLRVIFVDTLGMLYSSIDPEGKNPDYFDQGSLHRYHMNSIGFPMITIARVSCFISSFHFRECSCPKVILGYKKSEKSWLASGINRKIAEYVQLRTWPQFKKWREYPNRYYRW